MAGRPNVLILGGLDLLSPCLVQYLLSDDPGQPLVEYIRVVDKYSVNPPTTFTPKKFIHQLKEHSAILEYRQANLHNADVITKCFDDPTPSGRGFAYVFDFTGEWRKVDSSANVQIVNTFSISLLCAHAAVKRDVKAYVRLIGPFYDQADPKKKFKEEDENGWVPDGVRGVWWTEMLRAIGNIPDLPLVVVRCGLVYGPGAVGLEVTSGILLGLVYKRLNQEMKFLWSPKIRKNTSHIVDVAIATWKTAEWMASVGRSEANALAGVALQPTGDATVNSVPDAVQKRAGAVIMPIFNVTDDSDTTQESLSQVIGSVFGIKTGFYGSIRSMISGLRMNDVLEEVNELHMEQWRGIIQESTPPVVDTPLSPYMYMYVLQEHGYSLDGEKIKRVLNYHYRYSQFNEERVREFINWCREEGIWPESSLYTD